MRYLLTSIGEMNFEELLESLSKTPILIRYICVVIVTKNQ